MEANYGAGDALDILYGDEDVIRSISPKAW